MRARLVMAIVLIAAATSVLVAPGRAWAGDPGGQYVWAGASASGGQLTVQAGVTRWTPPTGSPWAKQAGGAPPGRANPNQPYGCRYQAAGAQANQLLGSGGPTPGQWVFPICAGPGVLNPMPPFWVAQAKAPVPQVNPAVVAQQAVSKLALPLPSIEMAPPTGAAQLVNVEAWLWIAPDAWRGLSATATAGTVAATATATPAKVVWDMGDGHQVTCAGPGAPYDPSAPNATTGCSYTWTRSGAYQVPAGGERGEVDERAAALAAGGEPERIGGVGVEGGRCFGGGGGHRAGGGSLGEELVEVGLADGARQPVQDGVVGASGDGQLGVVTELGGETGEGLGAGVVLDEELDLSPVLGPGAVGVGADELAVVLGAAPLGPPGDQRGAGVGAGLFGEGAEPSVDPEQVGESGAGGQAERSAAQVGRPGCFDAAFGGDEGGAGGPEGVVPGFGADQGVPAEPVEDPESGEAEQSTLGDVEAGEGELGDLGGGEHLMLGEDRDQTTVPVGEAAQHDQGIGTTASRQRIGSGRAAATA